MTAWIGATCGGKRSPESSPWTMIRAPIIRVVMPQEVCQTYWSVWFRSSNLMSKALEKCWPRLWDVPIWRALPSDIRASMA